MRGPIRTAAFLTLALLVSGCHAVTRGPAPAPAQQATVGGSGGPCFGAAPCYDTRGELVDHLGRRIPGQRR